VWDGMAQAHVPLIFLLINTEIHIDDVSDAYILLAEEALKPNGGQAHWGDTGYYFVQHGEFVSHFFIWKANHSYAKF